MIYYGSKELAFSFRTVRKNTLVIAEEIPEEKYGFKPVPEYRSVSQLLVHIALAYKFQFQFHGIEKRGSFEGFDFPSFMKNIIDEEGRDRDKSQIIELLKSEGDKCAGWLEGLSEDFLSQTVAMPPDSTPETKSRFEMILSIKEHEMHHRGQMMLIERLLGITPHLTREREARMAQAEKKS
ncbi:MAG: DinB family protein [Acidobacteriota bacterium]